MPDSGPAIALAAEDRAILALECPTVVGHTCKIIQLAPGGLTVEALRARVESGLPAVPLLTHRLGGASDAPQWVPDARFDINHHVVVAPVAVPLDSAGLRALAGALFAQHLDRSRPLWQLTVAPLADGGSVVIWRLHHALADGTTMMRWSRLLLWDDPETFTASPSAAAAHPLDKQLDARHLEARHFQDQERRRRHLAGFVSREYARSPHASPFDGVVGTQREVGFTSVSLGALKQAAHELAGATINDALLSVIGGGMRAYLEAHHGVPADIRVRVPVSLHHENDQAANRDSFFSLALPLHVADPVERLKIVRAETVQRKRANDAQREADLLSDLDRLKVMQHLVQRLNSSPRRFAVCVSNVPGPQVPVSIAGVRVQALMSLAEIGQRHGLRVAAVSLDDTLSIGFCADPALVPDAQLLADAAQAAAGRLIAARAAAAPG